MVVVDEELARVEESPVMPETESYVSGKIQSWATRDVANKKAELAEEELDDANQTISKMTRTGDLLYPIMFKDALHRQAKEKAEELDQREREINQREREMLELVRMHDETMQWDRETIQRDREDLRKEKQLLVLVIWSLAMAIAVVNLWARLSLDLDPEFGTSPCLYCDL